MFEKKYLPQPKSASKYVARVASSSEIMDSGRSLDQLGSHRHARLPVHVAGRAPSSPCVNVVRGHGSRKENVMFEIGMHDSMIVRMCDASKQMKSYPFNERKRKGVVHALTSAFTSPPYIGIQKTCVSQQTPFLGS
jgi:hypothetical protein